jgi:type VI secretion system protein ImpM
MDTPGVYGKLPGLGDFVSRRLPRTVVDAIDGWLQSVIGDSRTLLGERWLDCYLSAPIWRFVLGAGVVDDGLWPGALVPSVDRVGRYFPFVVAVRAPWHADPASALVALQTRADFDGLDTGLQRLVLPRSVAVPLDIADGDDTLPLPRASRLAAVVSLGADASLDAVAGVARSLAGSVTRGVCVWSATGADGGALVLVTEGLPTGRQFCAMLDGDWQRDGWECVTGE